MGNAFNVFQNTIPFSLTDEIQENIQWKRYVRRSLDSKTHEKEFQEWRDGLERHRKENPSHPSFEELYERSGAKKKRKHKNDESTQYPSNITLDLDLNVLSSLSNIL